jgi:uncharacterized membrane protein
MRPIAVTPIYSSSDAGGATAKFTLAVLAVLAVNMVRLLRREMGSRGRARAEQEFGSE